MSTRTELFPVEMIDELCKLQDRVGVVPFDEVIPTLDEYIPDWRDVFTSVNPKPLAAASISQVYRAVMQDGTILALKIQRPRITDRIEQDVVLLKSIAQLLEDKRPELRMYNPVSLVEDVTTQIRKELDFTRDGMNAERLARNMKLSGIPGIKIPKIYWDFSGKELSNRGLKAFMVQIFQNGFYHGDPHAGNLRISPSGTWSSSTSVSAVL